MTVKDLMIEIIKKTDKLAKKKFDVNRVRLTVGDAKGRALGDKR